MTTLPNSVRISYTGRIERNGPHLVPHDMAFPSAMVSLRVLLGGEHRTNELNAHGRTWRSDDDYYLHIGLSGEGFRFLFDTAEYFRFSEPEGAQPLLDCFKAEGITAEVFSAKQVSGSSGVWRSETHLISLVTDTLRQGYPALILGRTGNEWVLLATGFEKNGETLVGWMFVPGADMSNKSFSPEDCQYVADWAKGADAAVLITGKAEPMQNKADIFLRALERGQRFLLQGKGHFNGSECSFYEAWFKALHDESFWQAPLRGRPRIDPDIWDLAERRAFTAEFLEQAGEALKTDALGTASDAMHQIHDLMWKINSLCEGEDAISKLRDRNVRMEIENILKICRDLDLKAAKAIGEVLKKL